MKEIKLTGKYAQGRVAIVDDKDYEELSKYTWYAKVKSNTVYAKNSKAYKVEKGIWKVKAVFMHRFILNITDSKIEVDHKDSNGLNNQRENLRTATHSQNSANRRKNANAVSKYLGVGTTKIKGKVYYRARLKKNGKVYHKTRTTEVEAAEAYNELALKYHGEFARLNVVKNGKEKESKISI